MTTLPLQLRSWRILLCLLLLDLRGIPLRVLILSAPELRRPRIVQLMPQTLIRMKMTPLPLQLR